MTPTRRATMTPTRRATMTPTRRMVLAGMGAALALPARAAGRSSVAQALDAAAGAPPAQGLRMLDGLIGATPSERLDLEAAREGLAAEELIANGDAAGVDRFALMLRRQLGEVDPARARARIEREHARVAARADRLFRTIGLGGGSIGERYRHLWRDERFLYFDSDAGRDRAVADMNRALAHVRPQLAGWFGPLPPPVLASEARRMSPADEAKRRGGYREAPSPARPGAYFVDLTDIRRRPGWTLPGVVHHELLPGHMPQLFAEAMAAPHALRLRYAPAFGEGWAIYAETLPRHAGPHDELGHLHWLLFRLCRARVELGLHLDGWSVEQARARLEEWQGEPACFAPFEADLPRIAAEPATRTAEALCWLAIADRARGRTGATLARFHRALLAHGRMRLSAIRRTG